MNKHNAFTRFTMLALMLANLGMAQAQSPAPAPAANAKINPITASSGDANWREEYAAALGVQAYLYAFPWYNNQLLRWKWTTQPAANDMTPSMPLNQWWHARKLTDATHTDGGMPNNDTLYSVSWLDLNKEPLILSVPPTGKRYYSIVLMGFDGDNYAYVSSLQTGNKGGHYAITGPNWKGKLPAGIKSLKPATTGTILLLARTLVDGPDDLPAVFALQDQYRLTPLSRFGKNATSAGQAENGDVWRPYARKDDPLADWRTINRAMTEIPPTRDLKLVRQLAQIGIGPGQEIDKVDEATRRGLLRALKTGRDVLTSAAAERAIFGSTYRNGWSMTPDNWGHIGDDGDYLARAVQSLRGINASNHEEGMYITSMRDADGQPYSGSNRYVLHFLPGQLPPADAFWSLTAYTTLYNLIPNPINRYSIGDRKRDLHYDADGGLTLYLQAESPGPEKESNWLPTGTENFGMALRAYVPRQELLKKIWVPPTLTKLKP